MNHLHNVTCDEIEPLLPAAAAGALDPEDNAVVQAHLLGCPTCLPKLSDYEGVVEQLAYAVPQVTPPPTLLPRLLAAAQAERRAPDAAVTPPLPAAAPRAMPAAHPAPTRSGLLETLLGGYRRLAPAGFAVAFVLLLLVGGWSVSLNNEVRGQQQMIAMLRAPGAQTVALQPMTQTAAQGQVIMAPGHDHLGLVVTHLMPRPGRVYNVWLIMADGHIMPCGTVLVDADGVALSMIHLPADISQSHGIIITDEASPTAPAPSGTKWLEADYHW